MEIKIKEEHQKELEQILDAEAAARMGLEEAQRILYRAKKALWERITELYPVTQGVGWVLDFNKKILRKREGNDC